MSPGIVFDEDFLQAMEQQRQSGGARAKFERQLGLLRPGPGEGILDLGCGSGAHCRTVASLVAPGGRVVGVDVEADAIAMAEKLSADTDDGEGALSFQVADAHDLPFADGTFDAAMCISVLAFCRDPHRVLSEVGRVLRPGGRLLLVNSDEDTRIFNSHDRELGRRVMRAMADRAADPWIGRRLAGLLGAAGFTITEQEVVPDIEREFRPGGSGYFLAHALRDYLTGSGGLTVEEYERWLAELEACQEEGSYCYSALTFSYVGVRDSNGRNY
jgi:ubiquinone/menaquinone biosynthesis C-methylase UbiE